MGDFTSISTQILEAINKSHCILLHCHPSPDADSVGGVLAMSEALLQLNKQFKIISGDSPKSDIFEHLPGYDQVLSQSFNQIDLSQFDLFIIQDSSSPNQITKSSPVNFPTHLQTIVIDHHITNQGFGDINLIDPSAPSVCEILFYLFQSWELNITPQMAINLYVGIHSDTGGFEYPGTTTKTLTAGAQLAKINPEFPQYLFDLNNHQHSDMVKYLGLALTHLESYSNSKIIISNISYQDLDNHDIDPNFIQNSEVANILKSVIGWEIVASFIEIDPNVVKVSLRTRDSKKYNLGQIAAQLGGGGHPAAAGINLKMSPNQASQLLLKTIQEIYPHDFTT